MREIKLPKGWGLGKLEDLLDYIQPTKYIVKSTDYDDSYKTPVLTAGKTFVLGKTNEKDGIFDNLPVIIFDDFTTANKLVNFKFKVKSSAMKILKPKDENVNLLFVFYYIQTIRISFDTHKRYWISVFSKLPIALPSPETQQAIVSKIEELFSELDKGIEDLKTAQQQLKTYRQSVLKWAFEGKERILFENIIQSSQNGLSKRSGLDGEEFNVLRLADIKNNSIVIDSPRKIKMTSQEILKYKLNENDLVCIRVNGSKDLVGKIIFITSNDNKNKWAFCDHFIRFTIKDNFISKFIYHYFQTIEVRKFIHDNMVTSAGQNTVSQVTIKNVTVPTCNLEEQHLIVQEIESRLSVADKMEESIAQSLQQAEALRQSILKKAFSGELV